MYDGTLSVLSNRQSWSDSVELRDTDTGELIDISAATQIAVQVAPPSNNEADGYGNASFSAPLLTATLTNGKVQHVQLGVFAFSFTKEEMRALCGGNYAVEMTMEKDGETACLFLGTVPIREGVVTV
jgi:hypothetical protein